MSYNSVPEPPNDNNQINKIRYHSMVEFLSLRKAHIGAYVRHHISFYQQLASNVGKAKKAKGDAHLSADAIKQILKVIVRGGDYVCAPNKEYKGTIGVDAVSKWIRKLEVPSLSFSGYCVDKEDLKVKDEDKFAKAWKMWEEASCLKDVVRCALYMESISNKDVFPQWTNKDDFKHVNYGHFAHLFRGGFPVELRMDNNFAVTEKDTKIICEWQWKWNGREIVRDVPEKGTGTKRKQPEPDHAKDDSSSSSSKKKSKPSDDNDNNNDDEERTDTDTEVAKPKRLTKKERKAEEKRINDAEAAKKKAEAAAERAKKLAEQQEAKRIKDEAAAKEKKDKEEQELKDEAEKKEVIDSMNDYSRVFVDAKTLAQAAMIEAADAIKEALATKTSLKNQQTATKVRQLVSQTAEVMQAASIKLNSIIASPNHVPVINQWSDLTRATIAQAHAKIAVKHKSGGGAAVAAGKQVASAANLNPTCHPKCTSKHAPNRDFAKVLDGSYDWGNPLVNAFYNSMEHKDPRQCDQLIPTTYLNGEFKEWVKYYTKLHSDEKAHLDEKPNLVPCPDIQQTHCGDPNMRGRNRWEYWGFEVNTEAKKDNYYGSNHKHYPVRFKVGQSTEDLKAEVAKQEAKQEEEFEELSAGGVNEWG